LNELRLDPGYATMLAIDAVLSCEAGGSAEPDLKGCVDRGLQAVELFDKTPPVEHR
jgi:hypothetical protein